MRTMDPLHLIIAFSPLAVYLLLLGYINLAKHPVVMSGFQDAALLGSAISGFAVAGPLELFLPHGATQRFGPSVWLLLIAFYALGVSLLVLMMRPRVVLFNISAEQLRPILAGVAQQLDRQARWAVDNLALPQLGVQLHLERFPVMRNIQLVAAGGQQDFSGWRKLEKALRDEVRRTDAAVNPCGAGLMIVGFLIMAVLILSFVRDHHAVAQLWQEFLQR